jgi:hypothetical protein
MIPPELQEFGVGSIWRKRVAPAAFELRRIESINSGKVISSSHRDDGRTHYDYEFADLFAPLAHDSSSISLAGSGHRPEHIARGNRTLEEVRYQIFGFYVDLLRWLRPKEIIMGMARGFDMWFGWAGVETETKLVAAIPYPLQPKGWSEDEFQEWTDLRRCASVELMISDRYWEKEGDNALYARNRWMIDRGTHLTSFWQGTRGGTAYTNDYAVSVGKTRLVINTLNGWST